MAVEQMWLHRWKRQTSYSWYSAAGPVNILPSMMPSPAGLQPSGWRLSGSRLSLQATRKLGIVLVLDLEKKRGCVYWESLRGGTFDCCVLRIPGLPRVFRELNQNTKKKGVEAWP